MQTLQPSRLLLSILDVADALGVAERTAHKLRTNDPDFPKPIALSERCLRWRVSDLQAYIDAKPAVVAALEPVQLRGSNKAGPRYVAADLQSRMSKLPATRGAIDHDDAEA